MTTEPFHTALRTAIENRGLTLERICGRLASHGTPLSVSTLSSWQRGSGRPRRPGSRDAVVTLEQVLDLRSGALLHLLDPSGQPRPSLGPGTPRPQADRLRAILGRADHHALRVSGLLDELRTGPPGTTWQARYRVLLRAERSGVDRYSTLFHGAPGDLPMLDVAAGCRPGRSVRDETAGLLAVELFFPPLRRGESYPLEYVVRGRTREAYHGRWIRQPHPYELVVRFAQSMTVRSAYRVWRPDARAALRDLAPLRLIGGDTAVLIEPDPRPGFHGIRWE